jgi:septal ring factor EnvC (AmiA/AmiB activator)
MKAEEQTKLNETLSKVFKLDAEKLATLYNEAGELENLSVVVEADEKRIAKFAKEKDDQLKRGIKEGASKIEKELKDKFGDSDLIGVELVESIVTKQVEDATKAGSKDISKHPEYIKLQADITKQLKDRDKEWQTKLDQKDGEFKKAVIFDKVKSKALSYLDSAKAILPADVKKAENWKATYINALSGYNYQENEDGSIIVLDKDGKALQDSHANTITFDEVVKSTADNYFDYPVAEPRTGSGNKPPAGQPGSGAGEPKTKAEAFERLKDPKITPEDRKKYTIIWENAKE